MAHWDVIVVGTGGVGSAAVYHLAQRGLRVLGVDRFSPPHDRGSSHGQTRIIRQAYFEHPDYVPLAIESYSLWAALELATGRKLYHETGLVEVGPPDGVVVPGVLRAAEEHGLCVHEMSGADIVRRWPGLAVSGDLTGVFEPRAGFLLVEDCIAAHLEAARSLGAVVQTDSPIEHWTSDGGGVSIETAAERHTADSLIITAGAWAGRVLTDLEIDLTVRRKALLWYATTNAATYSSDNSFPAYLFEPPYGIFYGFPQIDARGVKVAEHSGGSVVADPLNVNRDVLSTDRAPVEQFLADHFPCVTHNLTDSTICMYTMSPDEHFILDRHPQHENVHFAAGLSGHGFKFTPVLGKALADLASEGQTGLPVEFLRLGRFR
jgi:sarcosine oxidase